MFHTASVNLVCEPSIFRHMQVGHNALGAGQIIDQGARLVDKAVQSGDIFEHDGWKRLQSAFEKDTIHFIGLLSDGGVHSRYDQLLLILQGGREGTDPLHFCKSWFQKHGMRGGCPHPGSECVFGGCVMWVLQLLFPLHMNRGGEARCKADTRACADRWVRSRDA